MVPFKSNTGSGPSTSGSIAEKKSSFVRSFSLSVITVWMLSIVLKWCTHRRLIILGKKRKSCGDIWGIWGLWNHCSVLGCQKLPHIQCFVTVRCHDAEAKCWQTFCMPKYSVKILWTALWLLLRGSAISFTLFCGIGNITSFKLDGRFVAQCCNIEF